MLADSNIGDLVSHPRYPTTSSSPRLWVRNPNPKLQSLLSHKRVKLRTFGWYIHRAYPNKSPFKILEKRESGRIQGLTNFFESPLLSLERVKAKATNFKFCTHIQAFKGSIGNKSSLKIWRKVAVGVLGDSKRFRAPYIGRSARSSLDSSAFLFLFRILNARCYE